MRSFLILVYVVLMAIPARSELVCNTTEMIIGKLEGKDYKELLIMELSKGPTSKLQVYVNPQTDTWSLVIVPTDERINRACMIDNGTGTKFMKFVEKEGEDL